MKLDDTLIPFDNTIYGFVYVISNTCLYKYDNKIWRSFGENSTDYYENMRKRYMKLNLI